jgi:hypothetical protein
VTPYVFEENGVESDVARVSILDVNERDSIRIAGDTHPLKVSYALALADSTDFLLTDLIERCPDPVYGASIRRIKSMARRIREHEAEIERLRQLVRDAHAWPLGQTVELHAWTDCSCGHDLGPERGYDEMSLMHAAHVEELLNGGK